MLSAVIHFDADAFFASVEQLDNPDLRMSASILGRQFAVEFYDQAVIGQRIKEWYEL